MQICLMPFECAFADAAKQHSVVGPALVAVFLLLVAQTGSAAEPLPYQPPKGKPLHIGGIWLTEGGTIGAIAHSKEVKKENTSLPRLPGRAYIHCVWDGSHLRIRPGEADKRMWSKDAIAKNGWYVTADYTTDPPRVIITEAPTAGSIWRFVAVSIRDEYYIRNQGRPGKEAWLILQPRQTLYRGVNYSLPDPQGRREARYWENTVADAVLTFDSAKREKFDVADIEAENGK